MAKIDQRIAEQAVRIVDDLLGTSDGDFVRQVSASPPAANRVR